MNTLPISALITHSLAWALLYSLWQGLLIYGCLYVLLKAMPNINSRARYYLSLGAFSGLFAWFADTWVSQYEKLKLAALSVTSAGMESSVAKSYTLNTATGTGPTGSLLHRLVPQVEQYYPFIMLLYTLGLSFMLFRFAVNMVQLNTLKKQGLAAAEQKWNSFIALWQGQLGISRPVKLFLSARINVPVMMGALKPVILLPIATINHLTTEQVEAILLHELAHIKRHDYLINILQTIGETILFFNPFVWLVSGIIRRERELCCDDLVVATAADPLPYASALALLESSRQQSNSFTLAASGHKNQLFHRIKRIMEMKKNNLNYSQLTIVIAAIVAIVFSAAMFTFTPTFAQKGKKSEKSDTTRKMYKYKTVTVDENGKETVEERVSDKPMKDEESDDASSSQHSSRVIKKVYKDKDDNGRESEDVEKTIKKVVIATKGASEEIAVAMAEMERELKKIDWEKVFQEINTGIAEVEKQLDNPKLRKEIKKELERSKLAMEDAARHIKEQKRRMDEITKEKGRTKSNVYAYAYSPGSSGQHDDNPEENDYETMLKKMEKDGLIDRSGTYSIVTANDQLLINGEKQSADVQKKYDKYLKDKTITIKGSKGKINISVID